jgi:hypothetical protein
VARAILQERFEGPDGPDMAGEARRQSLLVNRRRSERETLAFTASAADLEDWR